MNAIFLDIDGVLNNSYTAARTPMGFTGISTSLLGRLRKMAKETDSKVILSTSWKDEWAEDSKKRSADGEYLHQKLFQAGITIAGKIDESSIGASHRGAAIQLYLDSHPEIERYVILDDIEFDFYDYEEVASHFVRTDPRYGLTKKKLKEAVLVMKKERASCE